jgi:ABC-type proline/glycine betaine transport system permease subunit
MNVAEIMRVTGEHVVIVLIAVVVAIVAGIPLGIWCTRRAAASHFVLRAVDVVQTIPSLALFGLLIPIPFIGGIGMRTAIVALILYSLLPIVRSTFTGIRGVDPAVRDAGVALGLTPRQLLFDVELPLAGFAAPSWPASGSPRSQRRSAAEDSARSSFEAWRWSTRASSLPARSPRRCSR